MKLEAVVQAATEQPRFEDVPADASAAFTLREYPFSALSSSLHYHPEVELSFIVSGRGLRFVADSVEKFTDGDLCLLGPGVPHCWRSHPPSPRAHTLVAHFEPSVWGPALGDFPELRRIRELLVRAQRGLVVEEPARSSVIPFFDTIKAQPPGSWERLSSLVGLLIKIARSKSLRPLAHPSWQPLQSGEERAKIQRLLKFIQASIGPDFQQRHAAMHAKMSPAAFAEFFQGAFGKTFEDYLNELKIWKACQSLSKPNISIAEVAARAGFNNLAQFNARFRRFMGITPRQFRARIEGRHVETSREARAAMAGIVI